MTTIYKTFFFNSHEFSDSAIQSFNCVLVNTLIQDSVLSSLRSTQMDGQIVKLCVGMLLTGTYSSSKIKTILIQKVEESSLRNELFRQCLKILHEFGLKAGYHLLHNLDNINDKLKYSHEIHHPSRQLAVIVSEYQERLNSFSITSKNGLSFYSWNVFRMDDFDFTLKEYAISPKLKPNLFDDRSPQITNLTTINEDAAILVEDDSFFAKEIQFNDLIWIRPKNSASKMGSTRQITRSSGDQGSLNFMRYNKTMKSSLDIEQKEIDIDNIDLIFDTQDHIEDTCTFDDSCYDKLIQEDKNDIEDKDSPSVSRYDDTYALFHGLSDIGPSSFDKSASQYSIKSFVASNPIFVMKCFNSRASEDPELRNLLKSLGCNFECLSQNLLPSNLLQYFGCDGAVLTSSQNFPSETLVVQGVNAMSYIIIDNDTNLLRSLLNESTKNNSLDNPSSSPNLKSIGGSFPFVILYGFEVEIEDFKNNNTGIIRSFNKVISISKSFDVDVLKMQVTQVS